MTGRITGNTPSIIDPDNNSMNLEDANLEMKLSVSESIAAQLPSEEEVGSDKYVESLHQVCSTVAGTMMNIAILHY